MFIFLIIWIFVSGPFFENTILLHWIAFFFFFIELLFDFGLGQNQCVDLFLDTLLCNTERYVYLFLISTLFITALLRKFWNQGEVFFQTCLGPSSISAFQNKIQNKLVTIFKIYVYFAGILIRMEIYMSVCKKIDSIRL